MFGSLHFTDEEARVEKSGRLTHSQEVMESGLELRSSDNIACVPNYYITLPPLKLSTPNLWCCLLQDTFLDYLSQKAVLPLFPKHSLFV